MEPKIEAHYVARAESYYRGECDFQVESEAATPELAVENVICRLVREYFITDIKVYSYRTINLKTDYDGDEELFTSDLMEEEALSLTSEQVANHPIAIKETQAQLDRTRTRKFEADAMAAELVKQTRLKIYEEVKHELETQDKS